MTDLQLTWTLSGHGWADCRVADARVEASLAAAEQKLTAMRDLAARHTTVHLGMPDFRSSAGRLDAEQ